MRLAYSKPPIQHLSATAIAQLTTCPELFRLRRIKRIPESKGVDKFVGTVDHETLERVLRKKMGTNYQDVPNEQIPDIYNRAWTESIQEEEVVWYDKDPDEVHANGLDMAVLYNDQVTPTIKPVAVEERFEEEISGIPVPVVGYADVIENGRIIEKKTSKSKVSKPKPMWLLQGRIYQLTYDKPIEWHLSTRSKTPGIFTPENEEGLRLESSDRDSTALIIRQAWGQLTDLWRRYGPDQPWPFHGLTHPYQCGLCLAGPKNSAKCIAWGGPGYD